MKKGVEACEGEGKCKEMKEKKKEEEGGGDRLSDVRRVRFEGNLRK